MTESKTVLVTGANGYIGAAVARAFARAGWKTYGLVRSSKSITASFEENSIIPIVGAVDDLSAHANIIKALPIASLDTFVSTTENWDDYTSHYNNVVALIHTVSKAVLEAGGHKPLVIFSSGCKDYGIGMDHFADNPNLKPHTEESPLTSIPMLKVRTIAAMKFLEDARSKYFDLMDAVLVRPTNVIGYSSSFYGQFFKIAENAKEKNEPIQVPLGSLVKETTIMHALNVDDCGDAYVAIAAHPVRGEVSGQAFNISARKYETLKQVLDALAKEYELGSGVEFVLAVEGKALRTEWPQLIIDFPQWTDSSKLRHVTGWTDTRPLFAEAIGRYRKEAAEAMNTSPWSAKNTPLPKSN